MVPPLTTQPYEGDQTIWQTLPESHARISWAIKVPTSVEEVA